jgi:starvation-inducible DNA-binding protein
MALQPPTAPRVADVGIGLDEATRRGSIEALNLLLADEFVLSTKTRNYHWNVRGPHFAPLHKLFEEQYKALDEVVDKVAERVRALDGHALATLAGYLRQTRLEEGSDPTLGWHGMVRELRDDHRAIIRILRRDIEEAERREDAGTADLLIKLLGQHEKTAWMLAMHVEDEGVSPAP